MSVYPILMTPEQALLRRVGGERLPLMFCAGSDDLVTWQELELQQPDENGEYPGELLKIIDRAAVCLTFYVNSVSGGVGSNKDPGDGSEANPWHDLNTAFKYNYITALPGVCCGVKIRLRIAGTVDYRIIGRGDPEYHRDMVLEPWNAERIAFTGGASSIPGAVFQRIDFNAAAGENLFSSCDGATLIDCAFLPNIEGNSGTSLSNNYDIRLIRCDFHGGTVMIEVYDAWVKQCRFLSFGTIISADGGCFDDCETVRGISAEICRNCRAILAYSGPLEERPRGHSYGFSADYCVDCSVTIDQSLECKYNENLGIRGFGYIKKARGCTALIQYHLTKTDSGRRVFAEAIGFELPRSSEFFIDCHAEVSVSAPDGAFGCGFYGSNLPAGIVFLGCTTSPRICTFDNCDDAYYQCADITDTPAANGIPLPYLATYNRLSEDLRS